jgi:enoyl-CoA hydratase/carnithine racemase
MMLTERIIDAAEAYRIGPVNEVVPADKFADAALDAPCMRHAKEIENRTQILTGSTNNPHEAAMAHREKRNLNWDPL